MGRGEVYLGSLTIHTFEVAANFVSVTSLSVFSPGSISHKVCLSFTVMSLIFVAIIVIGSTVGYDI